MDSAAHTHIASWVKDGGKLLFCGTDKDPYQDVLEWWNSEGNSYNAPSEHLFSLLMKSPAETRSMMRVYFPSAPESVSVKDAAGNPIKFDYSWDQDSRTCLLGFDNSPEGVTVEFAM